jgi:hypothetical protein
LAVTGCAELRRGLDVIGGMRQHGNNRKTTPSAAACPLGYRERLVAKTRASAFGRFRDGSGRRMVQLAFQSFFDSQPSIRS